MKSVLFSASLLAASAASAAIPIDGWYASAFGGVAFLPNNNVHKTYFGVLFSDPTYREGFNAGGRIGFQSYPIRYELEYTFLKANLKRFDIDFIDQTRVSGNSHANVGMANLYLDVSDFILPTIYPFIGVGIGYANAVVNLNNNSGLLGAVSLHLSKALFAYQGTAGVTFNFAENFALNASYRYLATSNSNAFGKTFQVQMGDVGVVYRFDMCNYT